VINRSHCRRSTSPQIGPKPVRATSRRTSTAEGDFVVTRVAHHYTIGRITADALTQTYIESLPDELTALNRACELAGRDHRVFQTHLGRHTYALVGCAERAQALMSVRHVREWQRRHVTGVLARVTPVPGVGTWQVSVSRIRQRSLHIAAQFSLLTDAHDAGDRHAQAIGAHDCSHCGRWMPIERRKRER
jgi:hypothetical protein